MVLMGLRAQKSLLSTIKAEQLGLIHPWECPNVSIQYNSYDGELLLVGKLGVKLELFDPDAPTFHVDRSRIAELVREFKNAKGIKSSELYMDFIERPKQIKRLNSKLENDSLAKAATRGCQRA